VDVVSNWMANSTVTFGISAYNAGDGVLPTLKSLWEGVCKLRLVNTRWILSESHDQPGLSSAEPATSWARAVGAKLDVDSSDRRRSIKEALNVVFDRAQSDVLIVVVDDVMIPADSLVAMLHCLFAPPRPVAAIGGAMPDPAFSEVRRRAGAWQLRAVNRAALLMSRSIGPKSLRSEGAFWGVRRSFYRTYRFPIGSGSIHDDIELSRALVAGGYECRSAPEAFAYKVPPGSLLDLCSGTMRFRVAAPNHRRSRIEYAAALTEAARDPIGAFLYGIGRLYCRLNRSRLVEDASEHWRVSETTKRKTDGGSANPNA
jgi:hypothetical protein